MVSCNTQKVFLAKPWFATSCRVMKASLCRDRSCCLLNPVCPRVGRASKGVPHPLPDFRMVSCDKIKRDRASVASPASFEIPARSLSRQNFRTSFGVLRKSALIWSPLSADVLVVFFSHLSFTDVFCKPSVI